MRRSIRYLISSFMAIAGSLAFINFAKASDVSAINQTTGPESDNNTSVVVENENNIDINNDADVHNNINIYANTGGNEASMNTGDGMIRTGDAGANVTATTVVNKTNISQNCGNGSTDVTVGNDTTGAFSDNDARLRLENEQNIDVDNDANIDNDIDVRAETGDNEAKWNGGDGSIETGDAETNVDLATLANVTDLSLGDSFGAGDLTLQNDRTGFDSDNDIDAKIENENRLDINNDADIDNDVDFRAETGDNEAKGNCGDGDIRTGDANADIKVKTVANLTDVTNDGFGGMDVEGEMGNEMTGAHSDNDIDFNLENENEINVDNDANIDNDIDVRAETGNNEAKYNSCDGSIETGDANMDFELATKANETAIDMAHAGFGDLNIEAQNQSTGFDSDNDIDLNVENENELDLDNDLHVDNDLDLDAFTGGNEAEENCGDGEIRTGDVDVNGELTTIGNIADLSEVMPVSGDMDIEAGNECTGAESDNDIDARIENEQNLDIDNDGHVDNDVDARFDTGCNESEENGGDGFVESGDTDVDFNADTQTNIIGNDNIPSDDFDFNNVIDKNLDGDGDMNIIVNGDKVL